MYINEFYNTLSDTLSLQDLVYPILSYMAVFYKTFIRYFYNLQIMNAFHKTLNAF
jgi:hypothetical protein